MNYPQTNHKGLIVDFAAVWESIETFVKVGLGVIGTFVVAFYNAKIKNKKIDVDDRAQFTKDVLKRVHDLEQAQILEREQCEQRIRDQAELYGRLIEETNKRVKDLEENGICNQCKQHT